MQTDVYIHSDKESMYEKGETLGLKGEALSFFAFACYEVKVTLDVNEKTGAARIVAVDGRKVAE